jgi:alcohol dehydrogenase YqhD (iron-dependent ADH family)
MPYGLKKFRRFAEEVWNVCPEGKTDEQIAEEGLAAMEAWMKKMGVAMSLREIGVTEDMIEGIAKGTLILNGGYKALTYDEVVEILKASY